MKVNYYLFFTLFVLIIVIVFIYFFKVKENFTTKREKYLALINKIKDKLITHGRYDTQVWGSPEMDFNDKLFRLKRINFDKYGDERLKKIYKKLRLCRTHGLRALTGWGAFGVPKNVRHCQMNQITK